MRIALFLQDIWVLKKLLKDINGNKLKIKIATFVEETLIVYSSGALLSHHKITF